jgi:predicted Zn-dependent protease
VNAKLLSAGYVRVEAVGHGVANSEGLFAYQPATRAEFSMTVRDFKRNGAGWAGVDQVDWRQINPERIASIALEKCQQSVNPVAIEPGRYTVVLEPQAVADLVYPLIESFERIPPEVYMRGPWAYRESQTKIGQMVMDERVTLTADPEDPQVPFVPFTFYGDPYRAVDWLSEGVLEHLAYPRPYALREMNRTDPLINSKAFRMSGGSSTVPEMIEQTQRGILVTRFVNVKMIDFGSLLCSGSTSDGTWLIENGKITKAIKNFRIRESPLFVLNNLDSVGEPVRVFMNQPAMVPPVKARDFCMIALVDGV